MFSHRYSYHSLASHSMDQAASIFGVAGSALHVSFVPQLSAVPTKLPPSQPPHMFVIANTLVTSDKKVMGPVQYNLRVGELRMACRAISKELKLPQDDSTKVLKDLMETYFEINPLRKSKEEGQVEKAWQELGEEAAKMVKLRKLALGFIPEHPLTREEIEELTGFEGADYEKEFLSEFPSRSAGDSTQTHNSITHDTLSSNLQFELKSSNCMPD